MCLCIFIQSIFKKKITMANTPINRNRVVQIINDGLLRAQFSFQITPITIADISIGSGYFSIITDNNPYEYIFGHLALSRIQNYIQFTHFKSLARALDIVTSKEVQVSNLTSNEYNDYAEYTEFLRRAEYYHSLIPKDYCTQIQNKTINAGSRCLSDDVRDNTFILCFSQNYTNPRFWTDYAKNDTGVAIVFKFLNFSPDHYDKYDLRDVYYDSGYDFEFINYINYHLRKEFGFAFIPGSTSKFARFYKRQSYAWETETRLCFNVDRTLPYGLGVGIGNMFQIFPDSNPASNRTFIKLPLVGNPNPNPLFSLTIDEIVVGSNVSGADYASLSAALQTNFPHANIHQRP